MTPTEILTLAFRALAPEQLARLAAWEGPIHCGCPDAADEFVSPTTRAC